MKAGHAACVQRSRITSVYRWEGQCESTDEWRLQIKTSRSDKEKLIAAILADHPLDTPQIIAWKAEASSDYADWVNALFSRSDGAAAGGYECSQAREYRILIG